MSAPFDLPRPRPRASIVAPPKKRPVVDAISTMIAVWAGYFGDAWAVMYALSLLHRAVPVVPALGYWAVFWSIVAVVWVFGSIAYSAAWTFKNRWEKS